MREKSSVGSECAQLTNHSVGRPMYYIDEASGGVLRERDSQVTGFHSSHSSRNLWSHWKWIEWNLVCLKRWGSWRLVDWVFSGSWISRRFVRERRNRGWGLDVLAFASDGWFESSSIEWWGNGRMGTWGLEGIGVLEAVITEFDSIGW